MVCLHRLDTGELLALADSASITAWRTGLAAALASHVLADPGARTAGFVGAGAQAQLTWAGLRRLRAWDRIVVADLDPARAAALARPSLATNGPAEPETAGRVVADAPAVAAAADVVILATWSRQPLLDLADVRPGQHLTTLGADEPGKVELSRELLAASRVLTDDVGLAVRGGALGSAGLGPEAAAGTLGQVLRGELPARVPGGQPTVYAPVGLPWQDLALTWAVYQAARRAGAGRSICWPDRGSAPVAAVPGEPLEQRQGRDDQRNAAAEFQRRAAAGRIHAQLGEADRQHQDDHRDDPALEIVEVVHLQPARHREASSWRISRMNSS